MQRYTLSLDDNAANRIEKLVTLTSGSVPGYAARWAETISMLPTSEQEALAAQVAARITQLRAANLIVVPATPGVPTQPQGDTKTLLAQVAPLHPPTPQPQARQGKRAAKAEVLTAAT